MIKFGTSGWRAIISDEFTFNNVGRCTLAIARYLKRHKLAHKGLVVGYDTRFLSREFALAAAETLSTQKIKTYLSNRDIPTPAVSFHIVKKRCAGGINITASHNPAHYNGLKYSPSFGGPAPTEITDEIQKIANKITPKEIEKLPRVNDKFIKVFNPQPQYKRRLKELVDLKVIRRAKLKIGLDCMYGTSRGYLDEILAGAGVRQIVFHDYLNPLFEGKRPEPAKENLTQLIKSVKSKRLDLGLATDGDGDRFGIVDPSGQYISADLVISLIFYHLLGTRPRLKRVARTVATTSLIDKIADKFKVEVIETPVGFKYIGQVLHRGDCIIGGEESSGLSIARHVPEKDGILACLLVAEMVAVHKKSPLRILKKIFKEIGAQCYTDRIDVRLKPQAKKRLLKKLSLNPPSGLIHQKVVKINKLDGYKFILEDGSWIMFRPSGTEPIIRCYFESNSRRNLEKLKLEAHNLLH